MPGDDGAAQAHGKDERGLDWAAFSLLGFIDFAYEIVGGDCRIHVLDSRFERDYGEIGRNEGADRRTIPQASCVDDDRGLLAAQLLDYRSNPLFRLGNNGNGTHPAVWVEPISKRLLRIGIN